MEGIIKFEQIKPVDYEERSIRCLCNSNSSCSVEKRGTHTIALPLPLRALHLRGNDSVPKLKHKDSLKKALMVPFYSLLKQLVAHSLVLSLAEQEEAAEMVDLGLLTDDQLKAKLLQYGLKPGPIVATTRALYEKNLKRLLDSSAQASEHRVNGTRDAGLYSDSEEEDGREEDKNKDSESEQLQVETVARTETSKTARREPVTDVLSEIFPDTAKTPTGIYATKRRPIKGAAGRPVEFKYPEMPLLSPTTLERQEIQQRLVPLWIQIVVFLLVVCLLYLIYSSMEEPLSNPFTALLEGLQEAALINTSED